MHQNEDQKATNPPKSKPCPICNGTGFSKPGKLCTCITIGEPDIPDEIKEVFGDIFRKRP